MLLAAIHSTARIESRIASAREAINEFLQMSSECIGVRANRKDIEDLVMKLVCMKMIKIINVPSRRKDMRRQFRLMVPMNTVHIALKDNTQFGQVIDYVNENQPPSFTRRLNFD